MNDILAEILAHKRREVESAKNTRPLSQLRATPTHAAPCRDFTAAFARSGPEPGLIAEVKQKSPSAGVLRQPYDPVGIVRQYADGGAAALSVLTDTTYFGGALEHIQQVKSAVKLPVLRKDFLVDPYQVDESKSAGADAILLIADALPTEQWSPMLETALSLGMSVLVEAHSSSALDTIIEVLPTPRANVLIGINNRDLARQVTDLAHFETLSRRVPPGFPRIAESGIHTRADAQRMHAAGATGLLIGESLLKSNDPATQIRTLLGRS